MHSPSIQDAHALIGAVIEEDDSPLGSKLLEHVLDLWRAQLGPGALWRLLILSGSAVFGIEAPPNGQDGGQGALTEDAARFYAWREFVSLKVPGRRPLLLATLLKMNAVLCTAEPNALKGLLFPAHSTDSAIVADTQSSNTTSHGEQSSTFIDRVTSATFGTLQSVLLCALHRFTVPDAGGGFPGPALLAPWYNGFDGETPGSLADSRVKLTTLRGRNEVIEGRVVGVAPARPASSQRMLCVWVAQTPGGSETRPPHDDRIAVDVTSAAQLRWEREAEAVRLFGPSYQAAMETGQRGGPSTRAANQQRRLYEEFRLKAYAMQHQAPVTKPPPDGSASRGATAQPGSSPLDETCVAVPIASIAAAFFDHEDDSRGPGSNNPASLEDAGRFLPSGALGCLRDVDVARALILTVRRLLACVQADATGSRSGLATLLCASRLALSTTLLLDCVSSAVSSRTRDEDRHCLRTLAATLSVFAAVAAIDVAQRSGQPAAKADALALAAAAVQLPVGPLRPPALGLAARVPLWRSTLLWSMDRGGLDGAKALVAWVLDHPATEPDLRAELLPLAEQWVAAPVAATKVKPGPTGPPAKSARRESGSVAAMADASKAAPVISRVVSSASPDRATRVPSRTTDRFVQLWLLMERRATAAVDGTL
jgi:hypothetical protein